MTPRASPKHPGHGLIACPECDLLQRPPAKPCDVGTVDCVRCGAKLECRVPRSLELCTSLSIAAAVMFVIGNVFPLLSMTVQGRTTTATLIGMAAGLQEAGMTSVAALVAVTIVVMPALELAALAYLLAPLVLAERVPPYLRAASQLLELVKPWALIEVLMLGVLVSIGRLEKIGSIVLGGGFWALAAMMLLFALIDSVFELPLVWDRAEELAT